MVEDGTRQSGNCPHKGFFKEMVADPPYGQFLALVFFKFSGDRMVATR
jgi:hypothetical protein